MHRNTIRFDSTPPKEITLVTVGSMWPTAVEVDGEYWERTDEVVASDHKATTRLYRHTRWPKKRVS